MRGEARRVCCHTLTLSPSGIESGWQKAARSLKSENSESASLEAEAAKADQHRCCYSISQMRGVVSASR